MAYILIAQKRDNNTLFCAKHAADFAPSDLRQQFRQGSLQQDKQLTTPETALQLVAATPALRPPKAALLTTRLASGTLPWLATTTAEAYHKAVGRPLPLSCLCRPNSLCLLGLFWLPDQHATARRVSCSNSTGKHSLPPPYPRRSARCGSPPTLPRCASFTTLWWRRPPQKRGHPPPQARPTWPPRSSRSVSLQPRSRRLLASAVLRCVRPKGDG
jgi:hypothetical protein